MNINESAKESIKVLIFNYVFMMIATLSAGLSIALSIQLFGAYSIFESLIASTPFKNWMTMYFFSIGIFLAYRVKEFMANKSMPLTPENVIFMSVERIKWNIATLAILAPLYLVKLAIF